jgi:O-antigen/teichoic acid export membrane protein
VTSGPFAGHLDDGVEPPLPGADYRPDLDALGWNIRRGLLWKVASTVTAQVSRTAMTLILARLLVPAEFGLAGMVLVFTGVILLLTDVGFSGSLIQLERIDEDDRCTAFWTSVAVGFTLFALASAAAPAVADFYGEPRVRWMFVVVCTGFITGSLCTTQASLLWRAMNFRALELRAMLAAVASAAAGIGAALAGLGAWSLIIQSVALSVVSLVAIWTLSPWKPRFSFSRTSLRRMASFSANVFGARMLNYGDRNVDNLLVGRFLGAKALGIYAIGYSVIIVPFERLVWPIQSVLIPAFASMQQDLPRMRALWLRGVRLTATIMLPAMTGVIAVAPDFVTTLLGERWRPATTVIQILAWVALVQSLAVLSSAVYQSRNRSGLLLRITAFGFAVDATSFVIGLHWGVKGVATGYAVANTLIVVPLNLWLVMRLLAVSPLAVLRELRGVGEATVVMAAAVIGFRHAPGVTDASPSARLVGAIAIGLAVYLLMCVWRERRIFSELRPQNLQKISTT